MSALLRLLQYSRQSSRLIQSVLLAFVLSLGVAMAGPAVQAANLTPDQQVICLGSGGMKVVTFAADGSVIESQTTHGSQCLLCGALLAPPPAAHLEQGLQANSPAKPIPTWPAPHSTFQSRAPPARAPPVA